MLGAACVCGGVVRRGRWEIEVEERLEIVEHMQFGELRSRTLHEYQFMIAVSLDTGQCVDPNWCGRYSVSAFMRGGACTVRGHHRSCAIWLDSGQKHLVHVQLH